MKKATILSALFCVVFLGLSFGKEALSKDQLLNPQNTNKQKIERKEAILISSIKSSQVINHIENDQNQVSDIEVSVEDIKSQVINQINNNTDKVYKGSMAINSLPDVIGKTILENQSIDRKNILIINNNSNTSGYRSLYTVNVGGGSWDSEISWSLNTGESGAAGSYDLELADGDYVLTMNDSYGDGWNGGSWVISNSDGNLYTFGLESGSEGTADFSLPGEVDTTVYGCMLEGAPNYNADAEEDDGSCEFYAGADYGYWNASYAGYQIGCGLYYIFADTDADGVVDAQGDGACDDDGAGYGLACDAFACDGGDCEDCAGDCLGADVPSVECWDGSVACSEEDCPSGCENTECLFTMADAYGDGWNGNVWQSGDQSATLTEGEIGSLVLCFDLSAQNEYSCDGGSWASEVSWILDCGDGNPLSGGAPEAGCFGDCSASTPGCTDDTAENYDPDATSDDGTCTWNGGCSSSTQTACADGSCISSGWWCDGAAEYGNASWGPDCADGSDEGADCCESGDYAAEVCVEDCNGEIFGSAEEDCAGTCGGLAELDGNGDCCDSGYVDQCGVCDGDGTTCECSAYTLVIGGGSWDSEITWEIDGPDGAYESGAVGTFELCLSDGSYSFNGFDSYGDGWNGATATITNADGGLLYTFILETGDTGTWQFDLPGEVDTTVYGCMLEGAPNYNPDAVEEDGSCEFYAGANYGYWNPSYEGYQIGCGLYYIFPDTDFDGVVDQLGDGVCDNDLGGFEGYGLACEVFDCDGGDCFDCNDECAGDAAASTECWDGSLACSEDDCPDFCTDSVCDLMMYDSYGDGWNGASFTSGDQSVTLSEGSEGSVLLCFDLSVANDFTVGGGSWDSEITWTLDCADGNPLSGGAPYNGCVGAGCSEEPSCEDQWDACVSSLVDDYPEYWEACSAEDCDGGPGGACDGNVVPGLTPECGFAANNIGAGTCEDPCGGGGEPDVCFGLVIAMFDSYGDGWNGGVLTVGDQTFSLDDTTDGDGLSSGTACYQNEAGDGWDNNVVVTCGGSSYNSEISWAMYDYTGTVLLDGGAPYEGCLGDCGGGDECLPGDNNDDESINVQDIILVVNYIMGVSTDDLPCADMNGDGTINVQDIVAIVNIIMGTSARVDSATEATLVIRNNDLLLRSDGFIQGVQLTLSHGADFTITLENEYVSEYVTSENQTTVVLVTDGLNTLEKIGDTRGDYTILSSVVSDNNGNSILTNQTTEISNFMLTEAYPNPFNPTTNLSLVLSEAGYVSVKIYNIVGQQVAVLADGMYEANVNGHQLTWDASDISSGVYIVRAESSGQVSTQKLMLLK